MSKLIEVSGKDCECAFSPKSGFVFGLLTGVAVAVAGAAAVVCAVKLKEKLQQDSPEGFTDISADDDDYVDISADLTEESEEPVAEPESFTDPEE